jgi:hypothetical protein
MILKVTYGYTIRERNDPFVSIAEEVLKLFASASEPGAWVVDLLPWGTSSSLPFTVAKTDRPEQVRHIPEWFPGATFHRKAKEFKARNDRMTFDPIQFVRKQTVCDPVFSFTTWDVLNSLLQVKAEGKNIPSFVSINSETSLNDEEESILTWTAASLYGGMLSLSLKAL